MSGLLGSVGNDLPFSTAMVSVFLLVLVRTTTWAVVAPLISTPMAPAPARLGLGIALAIAVTPTVGTSHVPGDLPGFFAAVLGQLLAGLAMGFLTSLLLSAVAIAGSLADFASGFSFGSQLDPVNNESSSVFSRFLSITLLAVLAAGNGLTDIVAGFVRSFQTLSIDGMPHLAPGGMAEIGHLVAQTMVSALEIGAPLLGALFVTDAGLGLVARFVPQSNILGVSLSVKALVAFAALGTLLLLLPAQLESLLGPATRSSRLVIG